MANTKSTKTARSAAGRTNARRRNNYSGRSNREKKLLSIIIALAVLLVGSIGIAVAAFSTELHIHGTATVRSTVWDIHFANLGDAVTSGMGKEVTAPTIQTSTMGVPLAAIMNYKVELKEPGDSVEYTFDVVNGGDMDAELTDIIINTGSSLTCSSLGGQTVADKVCSKLNYTLTYSDGSAVAVGDTLSAVSGGNNTRTMKLKLEFDSSATSADLPDKDVEVGNLAVALTYSQAN